MRSLIAAVFLVTLMVPAMAAERGKLTAPPAGGWETALAAVTPGNIPALQRSFAKPAGDGTAVMLGDTQISEFRGGFRGFDFSVFFSGHVDSFGQAEGQFVTGGNPLPVPAPVFGLSDGNVNIQTHIGEFQGASGIFQIAQVPGDFNVVHNNLYIQINLIDLNAAEHLLGF